MSSKSYNHGQSLVELLVTMGLAALLLPAILTGFIVTRSGRAQQDQRLRATQLVSEAREVIRVVRENGWSSFAVNGTYHPVISGVSWSLVTGTETLDGIARSITISDAYRDGTGVLVSSGGSPDPGTKKIVIRASWIDPLPLSVETTEYVSRYNNRVYTETTEPQFAMGTKTGVVVVNGQGGEVQLGAGGSGNWCAPDLTITAIDLPKSGVANAVSAIEGHVFAGTGENASGVSYASIAISNPPAPSPPGGTITGTFDGHKTNGVYGEENYAYLATDTNAKEIVIIDLTLQDENGKYQEAGSVNAPGNGTGDSVYVVGSVGYMTEGDTLYTFDLTSKLGARPLIDSDGVLLAGTGKRVVVRGNYAYVAVSSPVTQLQIIDVTNPSSLTIVGQAVLAGDEGVDVYVNSTATRAYVATKASGTQREFFIVDVTTKTGDRPTLGSYDTQGMSPINVTLATNNKAIIGGTGGIEYQVIDITQENNFNLPSCGALNIDTGVRGIATVVEADGDAYAYVITGDATSELKLIAGGPGGQLALTGIFESQTFDAGSDVQFNTFKATAALPSQTELLYQVGIARAAADGSCNGVQFVFIGPDGTPETKFATGSALPVSADGVGFENPGQCLRYKGFFSSSDVNQSPTLYDIRFNYSL